MKVAVTGSQGFIGSHMRNFLEDYGYDVTPILGDLRKYDKNIFRGIDWVFHFAANMGGVGFFNKYNYEPVVENMAIDSNVLRACEAAGVKRLFYPASACAYPIDIQATESKTPLLKEDMLLPANADQMYGWEKLMMILLAREAPFIRVGILNTVFGEGQTWSGEKAKFPPSITYKVLQSKRTGKPIEIWGNGKQTRTFLYIQDAIAKIHEIMATDEYWGEVNVASDEIVNVKQCADWLCDIAGIEPNYRFDLSKPSGVLARGIDNSKFNEHYKYRSKFTTRQGFERLYRWMEKVV